MNKRRNKQKEVNVTVPVQKFENCIGTCAICDNQKCVFDVDIKKLAIDLCTIAQIIKLKFKTIGQRRFVATVVSEKLSTLLYDLVTNEKN